MGDLKMLLEVFSILTGMFLQSPDTLVVRADNPPTWGEDVRVTEELRIGMLDGPEEYVFGRVSGIALGPENTVYVSDNQVPVIRQYGPDGQWIRNIGRSGEGPGEYREFIELRTLDDETLVVLDPGNGRVTKFRDGTYSSSFRSLSGLHPYPILTTALGSDTAGCVYVKAVVFPATMGGRDERNEVWIRFDAGGQVLDTIPIPPEEKEGPGFQIIGKGGFYRPFNVMNVSAISPEGYLVTARNDEYALHRPLPDGRILRIERGAEPLTLLPEEKKQWDAWVEEVNENHRRLGEPETPSVSGKKPLIRKLFVDDDARIWVAVYAEARFVPYSPEEKAERGDRPGLEWNQPLDWEVFDPRGTFLGRITLPDGTSLVAARGNTVWGVQEGFYDEEYVVRFRLHLPETGS